MYPLSWRKAQNFGLPLAVRASA